jgi:uncharacterized membrane protein
MDPEILDFLKKISNSLGIFLLVLISNVLIGIYWKWGFVYNGKPDTYNIIYYIFALVSTLTAFYVIYSIWKNFKDPSQ